MMKNSISFEKTKLMESSRSPWRLSRSYVHLAIAIIIAAAGCASDTITTAPSEDGTTLYSTLVLNRHAVTLAMTAPYDTITLVATPKNPFGNELTGLGTVTYVSSDLARLRVSPNGAVQALAEGSGIQVIATLQANNLTHVDTTFITITTDAPPQPLASLSIHPTPPDSAKLAVFAQGNQLAVHALDAQGDSIPDVAVDFESTDASIASIDRHLGIISGSRPGHVVIIASATAYGVTRVDSLPFIIGLPVVTTVVIDANRAPNATSATTLSPTSITVGVGATVVWAWALDLPATDITFDDPTNVTEDSVGLGGFGAYTGSGNIAPPEGCTRDVPLAFLFNCMKARHFSVPGVYGYRSTLTGSRGEVIVIDEHGGG